MLNTLFSADLVYNGAHLYVAEKRIGSWLERLNELAAFAGHRVSTILSGHGAAGGLDLIAQTRTYLNDFAKPFRAVMQTLWNSNSTRNILHTT